MCSGYQLCMAAVCYIVYIGYLSVGQYVALINTDNISPEIRMTENVKSME